ncbi:MAG: 4Fe-4S dicluster domain-containing protein [Oscillospiraceae bacterium]|nr:4Fe-4S dicluster domain-containing protein [Oscillospiraceae bacterium]
MDFPFVREAVVKLFSKPSTQLYPAVPSEAAPGYRGKIVFHPETCINCGMCERVCAGGAISTTVEKTEEGDKITRTFDLGSCTFCNTCADFCSRHSIELTRDYHMIGVEEGDLLVSGTFIKAPPKRPAPKPAPTPKPVEEKKADTPAPAPEN